MNKLFIFPIALVLTACSQTSGRYEPLTSGIEVQAYVGPMCPVVQIGTDCPDQPYQATITILHANGKEYLQFETKGDGTYSINIPPGDYILRPESPIGSPLPHAGEQNFTVLPDEITKITVTYDSGIR